MEIEFSRQFSKDLYNIILATVKRSLLQIIEETKAAHDASQIKNLKKLKGHSFAFRIRSGSYRVGIFIDGGVVRFARVAHRKDIYKLFP